MKNLLILIAAVTLFGCSTPQHSVNGISYDGSKACISGNVVIYAPTVGQLDSTLQAITQNIISFVHIKDSANAHVYKYIICSPPLNQPAK